MRFYSLRSRNPFVAIALVIVALVAAFMIGIILLTTVALAGIVLGGGFLLRRKFGRTRDELPPSNRFLETLDPAMEVHQDRQRIPAVNPPDSTDPETPE